MKYKLTIAYEGTNYAGWQRQPESLSIQEVLEEKLAIFLRKPVTVTGAGRTDAGVHAKGQVVHFTVEGDIDLFRFHYSINGLLPRDIRVVDVTPVDDTFHARYSATNKIYHYNLALGSVHDPFQRRYSWHIPQDINLEKMREAVNHLIGTHDFTSFANEPSGGAVTHNPIRTIKRIDIIEDNGMVRLEFEGKSFLYKMVRNLTGTLVEVAKGKRDPAEIKEILVAKDRRKAGRTAPAHGLFLIQVDY